MAEINKDPQDVCEVVEEIMKLGTKVEANEFLDKLREVVSKNIHKAYDKFEFGVDKFLDNNSLIFFGTRKESQKEVEARVEKEEAKQKNIEEHELKEYLRLKKKFDKKKINEYTSADDL